MISTSFFLIAFMSVSHRLQMNLCCVTMLNMPQTEIIFISVFENFIMLTRTVITFLVAASTKVGHLSKHVSCDYRTLMSKICNLNTSERKVF
jgi:hypothetical protein